MISKESQLKQLVNDNPSLIELFNDLEIDYCCNGNDSLNIVSEKKNINLDSLIDLIKRTIDENKDKNNQKTIDIEEFKKLSLSGMIKSLEETHHVSERAMMLELDSLINKIMVVHYENHANQLVELHKLFGNLKTELEEHFVKEEKLIFPLVENASPSQEIINYINELEADHDAAGEIIKKIQKVTNGFSAPQDACMTYRRTFDLLNDFVEDIFIHIFKENSILFPEYEKKIA